LREEHDIPDRSLIGEEHDETVDADALAGSRRHAVLEGTQEVFVHPMGLLVAANHDAECAPVSGGSEGAAKGTLSIMVGGDAAQVARAMPILQAMGKTITHVGGQGAGQLAKLVNQVLVVVTMQAVGEALLLAQAGGLDLERTLAAVGGGAAGSWMLNNRGPQVIRRDWRPGFTIDLQQKDLRLVLETADALGIPLPSTAQVFQYYRALQQRGLGGEGNHALVKALEQLAGQEIGASG